MRRAMCAATVFVLTSALVATAQDPPPAVQPKVVPAQPGRPMIVTPARVAALEEEVEVLEANRDTKKAHVKAAEVGVRVAEGGLERYIRLAANKVVSNEEVEKAKLEVEVAKAQVEIRVAELKEVEVKIKHAKKRLDEAKAAPPPAVRPAPLDPKPRGADEKPVAELKAKLAEMQANLATTLAEAKKASSEAKEAQEELAKNLEAFKLKKLDVEVFKSSANKAIEAKNRAAKLEDDGAILAIEVELLRAMLKAIEK